MKLEENKNNLFKNNQTHALFNQCSKASGQMCNCLSKCIMYKQGNEKMLFKFCLFLYFLYRLMTSRAKSRKT